MMNTGGEITNVAEINAGVQGAGFANGAYQAFRIVFVLPLVEGALNIFNEHGFAIQLA